MAGGKEGLEVTRTICAALKSAEGGMPVGVHR